ncbi:MAG: sigma-54-dependent Fis family transcriptional regulator [Alphaproteobacteria bacterium]|nr:sigma-54-dependent Fis family transcriptional regulator [Alphaproteobacteria bacterium]MCB9697928.1 sigma-54-dependent Fis family transcriptional regulator [Alphaproteobacteria bacterium]
MPDERPGTLHGMVTVAPEMAHFFKLLERAARTNATVLLRGETGTGKELAAHALHRMSPRANRPFRAINCATLTAELLASELFGHVRGSFTGAVRDRTGLFQLADQGTVFLDEVAELPLDIQSRLLRVIQERRFVPLGGTDPISVDVRIVSATHRALRKEVEERRFREDLMYRLRVVVLYLPPLAERTGDVEALTWHFIRELNREGFRTIESIDEDAFQAMLAHDWPGNVRELRNNLEQAYAIGEGPVLKLDELSPEFRGLEPPMDRHERTSDAPTTTEDVERARILEALRASGGRKGRAAEMLGMSRSTLWRKIEILGLSRR